MKCKVAVIGAGVIGLTSAVRIQDEFGEKVDITLYTATKSPETTGDVSAGFWSPYLLGDTPTEKVIRWSKETRNYFLKLWQNGLATECGLSLLPAVVLSTDDSELPPWSSMLLGCQKFTDAQIQAYSNQHKNNYIAGYHFVTFTCEPSKLLPYLEKQFVSRGGRVELRTVKSFSELKTYDLLVNCTGLYSKYLNSDPDVKAIRGQVARVEAPWQFHIVLNDSEDCNYIIPNQHCVILGGTHQEDDEDTTPRHCDKEMILSGCVKLEPSLREVNILKHQVGLRPGRNSVKLGLETRMIEGKTMYLIQNYGHGGSGVTLSYGCAGEVAELAGQVLKRIRKSKL